MLSTRGERCTQPALPYWKAFISALSDLRSPSNESGAIPLCVAENKLEIPTGIISARLSAPRALLPGVLGYDDMRGRWSLRRAFSAFAERLITRGARVDPAHICISAGCGALISCLTHLLLNEGDAVLLPVPTYGALYNDFNVLAGATVIDVPRASGPSGLAGSGDIEVAALEAAVGAAEARGLRVGALFLINPDNPTGAVLSRACILSAIKWARSKSIHVVVDEIYALSEWGGHEFESAASLMVTEASLADCSLYLGDDVHVLWGFSKDFCASGLRTGVLFSHNALLLTALDNLGYFMTVSNDTQDVLAGMLIDTPWVDSFISANRKALSGAYAMVASAMSDLGIPFVPATTGMFIWFSLREFIDSEAVHSERQLADALWREHKLVFTPGEACHAIEPGWFRWCYASSKDSLPEAIRRFRIFVNARRS